MNRNFIVFYIAHGKDPRQSRHGNGFYQSNKGEFVNKNIFQKLIINKYAQTESVEIIHVTITNIMEVSDADLEMFGKGHVLSHTIIVPFANEADDKKILNACTRHGVTSKGGMIRGQKVYELTTTDVSNFYWLGANMEHSLK